MGGSTMQSFFNMLLFLFAILFLSGCAGTSHDRGNLVRAPEVSSNFEHGRILPDHTYYFSGPEAEPDAIIGIHNSYTFDRGYWKTANISEEKMAGWNRIIANQYRGRTRYSGYRITTPDGKPAGIWYGKYSFTVIKFPQPGTIVIYTPDPAPNERRYPFGSAGGANFD